MLGRFSIAYDFGESDLELAEYAVEYYKDISSNRRYVVAIEGEDDEIGLIGELQWLVGGNAVVKINTGVGLTNKAADFSPEIGIMWYF
ncbi:hypothetical protein [Candidatus Spongiihabitans sp.]|uniref:hypothetical protein n=1 Tax=Candidatus Spongiihabitans sp. TaxID=3101308 RepID=UPI003C6F3684